MLPPAALLFPALYLLPLYIFRTGLPRNHPRTIWTRTLSTTTTTLLLSWVPTYRMLKAAAGGQALSVHDILLAMGLRSTGLAAACTLPLLLTALLFAGPLLMSWLDRRPSGPKRGPLLSPLAIRSYIAAPITEEAWFRCGLCSYLLLSGVSQARCIWLAPALFGASHLHHAADQVTHQGWPLRQALAVSAFQFCYTSVFGWFAGFLLLRTGHMAAVVAVHSFCNFMGLPMFGAVPSHKKATLLAATYLAGIAAFAALLLPLTQPQLYGYPAGQSFATTVVQLPSKMGLPAL